MKHIRWTGALLGLAAIVVTTIILCSGLTDAQEFAALGVFAFSSISLDAVRIITQGSTDPRAPTELRVSPDGFEATVRGASAIGPELTATALLTTLSVGMVSSMGLEPIECFGVTAGYLMMITGLAVLAQWLLSSWSETRVVLQGRILTTGRQRIIVADGSDLTIAKAERGRLRLTVRGMDDSTLSIAGAPATVKAIAERLGELSTLEGERTEVPSSLLGRAGSLRGEVDRSGR